MTDEKNATEDGVLGLTPEAETTPDAKPEAEAAPAPEADESTEGEDPTEGEVADGSPDAEGFSRSHLADHFNPTDVPKVAWRIIKDPDDGIAAAHIPGTASLLHGMVIGGFSVLLIGLLRVGAWPATTEIHQELGTLAGGLVFLGIATLFSFLMRISIGKIEHADWHDDAFLVGGSMLYAAVFTLIAYPLGKVYDGMGAAVSIVGVILASISYFSGIMDLGKVAQGRAIFITMIVFVAGMLASAWMGFLPYLSYVAYMPNLGE